MCGSSDRRTKAEADLRIFFMQKNQTEGWRYGEKNDISFTPCPSGQKLHPPICVFRTM